MKEMDLQAGLRSLHQSLRQMKSLLAWQEMKAVEARPGQPPAFQIHDPTEDDLKNEYSSFVETSLQMHLVLNDDSAPTPQGLRESIERQLAAIERQVCALSLNQRFWRD